jgi:hypothetical protein
MKHKLYVSVMLLACLGATSQAQADSLLTIHDITPTSGSSASIVSDGILQLTDNSLSNRTYQIGSAYSSSAVDISSFSASFSFQFSGGNPNWNNKSADGIVFVIKNTASRSSGGPGGGLGYASNVENGITYTGIENSIGIEFDNWTNSSFNDPTGNVSHIGINKNGNARSLTTLNISPAYNGNGPWYAWVDYNGADLSVSVSTTNSKPGTPMLTYNIGSLESIIGSPAAVIGFTGSTGLATQTEQVLSLDYQNSVEAVPEPGTLTLLGTIGVIAIGRRNLKHIRKIA